MKGTVKSTSAAERTVRIKFSKQTFPGFVMKPFSANLATVRQVLCLAVCLTAISCSSKAPEPNKAAPTISVTPLPTVTSISTTPYDASNLAAKYPSLINVPEIDTCKTAGKAFIRGKFNGADVNRCSNVTVESGWCDFQSIAAKFSALGRVTLSNAALGISEGKDPSAFFAAVQAAGWLPDQCGTVDAGSGAREPVVFLYHEPINGGGLGVMPVCLPLGAGAPVKFINQSLCEI